MLQKKARFWASRHAGKNNSNTVQSQMRHTTWVRGDPSADCMRLLLADSGLLQSSGSCRACAGWQGEVTLCWLPCCAAAWWASSSHCPCTARSWGPSASDLDMTASIAGRTMVIEQTRGAGGGEGKKGRCAG